MIRWLSEKGIRAQHGELIAEHGGLPGPPDTALLQSTLARLQNLFAYNDPTVFRLAASYGFGFCKNHCFPDGNKRIALSAIGVFLIKNSYRLVAPEVEAVTIIRRVAANEASEAELAEWIKQNAVSD